MTYSLTQAQLGMCLEWNADRSSTQYVICIEDRFPVGTVDVPRLAAALQSVFRAYPALRTHLVEEDGELRQFADDNYQLHVEIREIAEDAAEREKTAFMRPYLTYDEPFMRAAILVSPQCVRLLLGFIHLIMDGTSIRIFNRAVAAAYEGRPIPSEPFGLFDYAALEPSLFDQPNYTEVRNEHIKRFSGKSMAVPEDTELMHTQIKKGELIRHCVRIERSSVENFCRAHQVHPNLFFMGAFARTLALYTNRKDVVFYTVNHGRKDPRLHESIGAFVKSVPCLAELKGEMALAEFLSSLKLHNAGVYPFTHFCCDLGMTPGFGFVFQDGTVDFSLTLNGVKSEGDCYAPGGVGLKPVMEIYGDADNYDCHVSCLTGEYTDAWVKAFSERFIEVVRQFLAHSENRLGEIPVISDEEAEALKQLGAGETLKYDTTKTIVEVFDEHVKTHPDATAVVDCEGALTYAELAARATALATKLPSTLNPQPSTLNPLPSTHYPLPSTSFVALMLPRRVSFVVAVLAAQKSGAGYVPLDAEYPADRLSYMLENSEAKVLITTHELFDGKGLDFSGEVIFYDDLSPLPTTHYPLSSTLSPLPHDLHLGVDGTSEGRGGSASGADCALCVDGEGDEARSDEPCRRNGEFLLRCVRH